MSSEQTTIAVLWLLPSQDILTPDECRHLRKHCYCPLPTAHRSCFPGLYNLFRSSYTNTSSPSLEIRSKRK